MHCRILWIEIQLMRSAVDQSKNQSLIFGTTKMNCTLNRNESVFNCVISSQSTIDKVLTCIRIFPKRVCVGGQDGGNTEIINKSKSDFASNLMPKNTRKSTSGTKPLVSIPALVWNHQASSLSPVLGQRGCGMTRPTSSC